jgi:hypothetical protein
VTDIEGYAAVSVASYLTGKHFYVRIGDQYTFRDIDEAELNRLPSRSLWPFSGIELHRPPDFVIEVPSPKPSSTPIH